MFANLIALHSKQYMYNVQLLCSCDRHLTKAMIFQKNSIVLYITILPYTNTGFTDKKEEKKFLIYKEIQMGAVEKLYMRKGFLI